MAGHAHTTAWRLLERLRYQSHSGRVIRRHRALRRVDFARASVVHPLLLLAASYVALGAGLPAIVGFWTDTLAFWLPRLDVPAALGQRSHVALEALGYAVPFPLHDGRLPDASALWTSVAAAVLAMALAFVAMRGCLLPLGYLVWGASLIQLVASAAFALAPGAYTHTVASHVATGLEFALVLVFFAPLLLTFSYYVFDYGLARKLAGTVVVLAGLIIVAPYQYLVHTLLLEHATLVLMPLLFVGFGLLFDIAVFIALYAWVVSWES